MKAIYSVLMIATIALFAFGLAFGVLDELRNAKFCLMACSVTAIVPLIMQSFSRG